MHLSYLVIVYFHFHAISISFWFPAVHQFNYASVYETAALLQNLQQRTLGTAIPSCSCRVTSSIAILGQILGPPEVATFMVRRRETMTWGWISASAGETKGYDKLDEIEMYPAYLFKARFLRICQSWCDSRKKHVDMWRLEAK